MRSGHQHNKHTTKSVVRVLGTQVRKERESDRLAAITKEPVQQTHNLEFVITYTLKHTSSQQPSHSTHRQRLY